MNGAQGADENRAAANAESKLGQERHRWKAGEKSGIFLKKGIDKTRGIVYYISCRRDDVRMMKRQQNAANVGA